MPAFSERPPLTGEERQFLLRLAREAIVAAVSRTVPPSPLETDGRLNEPAGVFVTLHLNQELRGCIGQINPPRALYLAVIDAAQASALDDPRFLPVEGGELAGIEIEISVLSPMFCVTADEAERVIEIGRHGLMVSRGTRRGLLLPQVPGRFGWGAREFLEQTCRKAGLHPDAWREDASLQIFTAEIFSEEKAARAYSSST